MKKPMDPFECQGCWEHYDWKTKSGRERRLPKVVVDCPHCGRLAEGPWSSREQLEALAFGHREEAWAEMRRLNPDMPKGRVLKLVNGRMVFTSIKERSSNG